ncbi:glutamate--tRNA ligase [Coemansia sp. Benny D115]|nr:glutamate--tRNA ligase [Coemansia sp. Benny D115]
MATLQLAQKGSPLPYIAGALAEFANEAAPGSYTVSWHEGTSLKGKDKAANAVLTKDGQETVGEAAAVKAIQAAIKDVDAEAARWVQFAEEKLGSSNFKDLEAALAALDHHLVMRSYVAGYAVTAGDAALWGALRASAIFQRNLKTKPEMLGDHLVRWYAHISSQEFVARLVDLLQHASKQQAAAGGKAADQGSFDLGLKDVEYGKVVTRFPPEPSGYLHIGHAKAALLNEYVAKSNGGKLIVRFDDTNPTKEKVEFEESILEDLKLLGIKGDLISHTSDHFQTIYEYALKLIKKGLAYVDDTDQETMREERKERIVSKCRDLSLDENLQRFEQMKQGTEFGLTCSLRAKISVDSLNGAMRDPGVTHALRSMEYRDRNPQYEWFFPALDLRPVQIMDFSRMNFVYTLLSKRKLQWFVDNGYVSGWDDPRFPTVRGIRRRGMTIEALRQYVLMQGASQKNMLLEWDKIWALNKRIIDPVAPRHTGLLKKELVPVTVVDGPEKPYIKELPKHKKNPELGVKHTVFSSQLFIGQEDAASFEVGEEITLMDWGNAIVKAVEKNADGVVTDVQLSLHLEGDVKATKKKITWLGQDPNVHPVEALLVDYDYLITKKKLENDDSVEDVLTPQTEFTNTAIVDANVANLAQGAIIQLERDGYYIVDKVAGQSDLGLVTLVKIPDGKAASTASKQKSDGEAPPVVKKAAASAAGAKGSPWDKGSASKGKKAQDAAPAPAAAAAEAQATGDSSLNLPKPNEVCDMYETRKVYGDIPLGHPKDVCDMYETKKFY